MIPRPETKLPLFRMNTQPSEVILTINEQRINTFCSYRIGVKFYPTTDFQVQWLRMEMQKLQKEYICNATARTKLVLDGRCADAWRRGPADEYSTNDPRIRSQPQLQRSFARKTATLRNIQTNSRLGLRANRGSEYSRLGSSRKSRIGNKPLRFFWSTPSLVPLLPEEGASGEERRGDEEGRKRTEEKIKGKREW